MVQKWKVNINYDLAFSHFSLVLFQRVETDISDKNVSTRYFPDEELLNHVCKELHLNRCYKLKRHIMHIIISVFIYLGGGGNLSKEMCVWHFGMIFRMLFCIIFFVIKFVQCFFKYCFSASVHCIFEIKTIWEKLTKVFFM